MAKILLVEDDNNLREIYQARLTAEGYDIVAAQNGEEALVVAKQHRPDLIISDVMMPRISGFEMLDIIRNTDELKATKVIMLTALGQAEDQTRAGNLGADRYLVKSQVTLEDIVNAARDMLAGATIVEPNQMATTTAATPVAVATSNVSQPADTQSTPPIGADPAPLQAVAAPPSTPLQPGDQTILPPDNTALPRVSVADPDPIAVTPTSTPATDPEPPASLPQISSHATAVLNESEDPAEQTATVVTGAPLASVPTASPTTDSPALAMPPVQESIVNSPPLQSLAAEEAAVAAQIAGFVDDATATTVPADLPQLPVIPDEEAQGPSALPPPQSPEPAASPGKPDTAQSENDSMLASALGQLQQDSDAVQQAVLPPSQQPIPADATPAPSPVTLPAPAPVQQPQDNSQPSSPPGVPSVPTGALGTPDQDDQHHTDQVTVAGKKIIAPITKQEDKADLNDLLRQQEQKDLSESGISTAPITVGGAISPEAEATAQSTPPVVPPPPIIAAPASTGIQPAPIISPSAGAPGSAKDGFDPNSIAL